MRYADTLNVYSKLREGFEEKEAKIIALAIENAFEEADEILLKEVATKEDIANLRTELKEAKVEMATKEDMAKLRAEFKEEITIVEAKMGLLESKMESLESKMESKMESLESKMESKMESLESKMESKMESLESNLKTYTANFKTEIIKWMFLFWIGQSAVIFGIIKFVK